MTDYGVSFVRTATPMVVGLLASTVIGPMLDPELTREAVAAVLAAGYYAVARFLEVKLGQEWAGWLLGIAMPPLYKLDVQVLAGEDD